MNIPVRFTTQDPEYNEGTEVYEGTMIAIVGGKGGIYGVIQTEGDAGGYFQEVALRFIKPLQSQPNVG